MEESLTKVSRYDAQWGITTRVEKSRVLQKKIGFSKNMADIKKLTNYLLCYGPVLQLAYSDKVLKNYCKTYMVLKLEHKSPCTLTPCI